MAANVGAAVLIPLPFGRSSLFKTVKGKPLPPVAQEIGATSRGQVLAIIHVEEISGHACLRFHEREHVATLSRQALKMFSHRKSKVLKGPRVATATIPPSPDPHRPAQAAEPHFMSPLARDRSSKDGVPDLALVAKNTSNACR